MRFNKRLETAILNKFKNINQFSEAVNISANLIRSYIKEESIPSIDKAQKISNILEVSLDWLVSGEELISNNKEEEIIDLINIIHERIDLYLEVNNKEMESSKKSILVKILYNQFKEQELSKDKMVEKINNAISILDVA